MLRLEGLALLAAAAILYARLGGGWPMFGLLFLVPDLSFVGYLAGPRVGAATYNTAHSTVGPLLLGAAGVALHQPQVMQIACIWGAHVGFDRALGYGLKYASAFGDTHLGHLGKKGSIRAVRA